MRLIEIEKSRLIVVGTRETINWWIDNVVRPLFSREFYGNVILKSVEVSFVRAISENIILPVINLLRPDNLLRKYGGESVKTFIAGGYLTSIPKSISSMFKKE